MTPHPDHEFFGADPDDYAEAWSDLAYSDGMAAFDLMTRQDQQRFTLRCVAKVLGTPIHEDLEPEIRAILPEFPNPDED